MASFWYASSILNLRTVVNSGDNTRIYVLVYGEKINSVAWTMQYLITGCEYVSQDTGSPRNVFLNFEKACDSEIADKKNPESCFKCKCHIAASPNFRWSACSQISAAFFNDCVYSLHVCSHCFQITVKPSSDSSNPIV